MPFYTQEASSSTSFHTARRSTPEDGSRSSLVINMVDPFIRLRPKSTRKSNEDEWYIPYSKPPPPSSYIGIGASPHAPPQKQSSLMSYLHAPLTPASIQNDGVRTYRFPTTLPARSFPQRPLPTGLQPPDSAPAPSISGMRVPTTSSVPTGLTAPKLLFSPLAREARQPPDPPEQPIAAEVRARTTSAPARSRNRANDDSKRWVTPTVCDRFVFPRPAITPLVITPPSSPERVTDDRSSFLSKEEWRVMDEGKKRLQEREDWADYVQRRGRSMSFGDQRGRSGAPIIGNARMRTKEHEKRLSKDSGRSGRRNSLSSLFRRSTDKNTLHPSASDDNVGMFNSFGFPRRMSTSRAAPSQQDDPLVALRAAGEDFFPSRYPSHRYGGIRGLRGHTHTRSSPDLSQVSREASLRDAPPLPPGPPPRTLRIQPPPRSSYRGNEEGVIVIGPGSSAYRAPPPEPRRPTDLDAFTSARSPHPSEPTFRSRAPRPLDLAVTVSSGYASAPSTGVRSSQRSSGANVNKALPDVPRADNSPTLELAPFSDLTTEVGKAMSPEMRTISGLATIRGAPRPPRRDQAHDSTLMYFNTATTPFRTSDGSSAASPFRKSDASGRDSTLSPARALLVKQHQLAKTKRAFQSPAGRQPSYRSKSAQSTEPPLWQQDSVATPSSAPHSNASFSSTRPLVSQPTSASTAVPPTAYKRKATALEEAIGRSRAGSLSTLEQQDPLAKSSSNRALHKAGAGSDGAHAAPYLLDPSLVDPSFAPGPSSTPRALSSDKSPVLGPPIGTPSSTIVTPTPARYNEAPFLPLPPNPPNMLRTDTSTTTQSKTTAYSSASEGWGRGIDSGTVTPTGVLPGRDTPAPPIPGDHSEDLDQGTPRNPQWTEDARTPQNPREESPDDSPDNHMDERDFAGLFFRTPKDDEFSSPGTLIAASPGTLGGASRDSSGLQPAHEFARENTGLGIGLPLGAPTDATLAVPAFAETRRPSDASNHTNGTNGTNGTGGTAQTGGTGDTAQTGGTGGSGLTQITTPPLGEQADVGSSSQESHSGPSAESAGREDRDATLRARPKARLGESDASVPLMFPTPPRPPLSVENPEAGNRRVSPEPTQSSTPVTTTPTSSTRNLPGTRAQPFSPGTFGHPTPKREREDYFGHRSNPSAGSQSTKSARSGQSGQSVPVRPPRPPSPGLEAFRQSADSGPIITFARTGDTISPVHSPPRSARSPSSESFDRGRFSAVPSFVSDFPSPPLPHSPTITQFSQAPPTSVSASTLTPTLRETAHTSSSDTILPDSSSAPPVPPPPAVPSDTTQVDEFGSLPASPNTPGSPPRQVMSGAISSPSSPSRKARRHGMAFGQVISGSPGAGKSTYASGMQQFLSALHRPCHIINLDPATPNPSYPCAINITDLVSLEDVMREHELGPNGAMLYCAEYLEANTDWLVDRLDDLLGYTAGSEHTLEEEKQSTPGYVIFDTPGQVELWTNHDSFKHIIESLTKLDYRLVSVHLSDAQYITDASTFISIALLALRANMQLELPHINVLSKIDRLATYGELPFDLRYYTECRDLEYLLSSLDSDSRQMRMAGLNRAMVELIEQYGAVSFETLAVEDKRSMLKLLRVLDNAIGYIPLPSSHSLTGQVLDPEADALGEAEMLDSMPTLEELGDVDDVQERWGWRKEEADKEEEEAWGREWEKRNARNPIGDESQPVTGIASTEEPEDDEEGEEVFRGATRAMPLSGMAAQVLRPNDSGHDSRLA